MQHMQFAHLPICATERKKLSQKRKRLRSSILIKAPSTKKGQNHSENKQLPFASQLKNNKSQKWPVAAHLNTHINHKNSYTVPWQCIATVQNFSQGERRQKKKHLITSNSCKPFWSPKVLERRRPCVCSVSGNDLPSHEHCYVLQHCCPQHPRSISV